MLRFSNRLLSLSALVLMLGTGAAQAQKFAIINMQQAVLLTTDGKKASAAINAKFTPVKAEVDQMAKDIQAKQDAFTKNRATLSPSAATAAQAEIQDLTTKLQRRQQDAQQDLQDEENKLLAVIVPKLQQIINQYAAANGATLPLIHERERWSPSETWRTPMNIDMQNDRVQQNDNRSLNDDELCAVQGGSVLDVARVVLATISTVLRMASGRPQL